MRYKSTWGIVVILLLVYEFSFANSNHPNLMNTIGFKQNYNIYQWWYKFNYQKNIKKRGLLAVTENFKSSFLRIYNDEKKWKDDQQFGIDYSWRFSPKWIGKLISSSLIFSDRLSGITNDIKTSFGSIGVQYNPVSVINLSSQLGYKFDSRFDHLDHGTMYAFDINTPFVKLTDYYNRFKFSINGDDFVVRKNKNINLSYQVKKEFYTDTNDSLSIRWSKIRRDNYDLLEATDLYVESLNEERRSIHNSLNYKVNNYTKLQLTSSFSTKWTEVSKFGPADQHESRSKNDFTSVNQLNLKFQTTRFLEKIRLSYYTERQRNDVPDSLKNSPFSYRFSYISPDFKISRLSLANVFNFAISKHDSLATDFVISIFRYDTPEKTNYDDRDEQTININISEIHYFSRSLKLKLNMGVNLKHLVFIYGEKSADNNWMRIFRLKPEIFYRPNKRFKFYQAFEVLANYVDYDFDQQMSPLDIRSYVFRKFTMQQNLKYRLSLLTSFMVNYKLELEENGKLFWDRWAEMIIITRQNHYNNAYFDFHLFTGATISLGAVFLMRKERLHIFESANSSIPANNNYTSFGPSLKIKYKPHTKLVFLFTGTRRSIDRAQQKRYFINNINMNLSWYM